MNNPKNNSGFAAGTLVHTQTGLKPIEQIQVGDFVLSKAENDGEQAYKRVTQTFELSPVRIIRQSYYFLEDVKYEPRFSVQAFSITTSMNQLFWTIGKRKGRWTEAKNYLGTLMLCDGRQVRTGGEKRNIYKSNHPEVGWIPSANVYYRQPGWLWDFTNNCCVASNVLALQEVRDSYNGSSHFFKLTVYNLEVEDFHSYFIGEHGVLIHDATGKA